MKFLCVTEPKVAVELYPKQVRILHKRLHVLSETEILQTFLHLRLTISGSGFPMAMSIKIIYDFLLLSQNSVVSIATGHGLNDSGVGVRVPVETKMFSFPSRPDRLWGPSNLLYSGYREVFLGVKRRNREADHSSPACAEDKKMWNYIGTPPYTFTA
jgi:hypothetical protein